MVFGVAEEAVRVATGLLQVMILLAVKSSDALLTMLRTVNLAQIEGPSGFLHFKEDINDLLRVNSENKVAQVLINSMVVE